MASSSYESTPETTNTNRVIRVILGPCTDGLRDILRHYIPPSTFPHVIKVNKKNLWRLTADQQDLISLKHGSYTGNYSDMDISLLYILLRNITGIPPHANGWSNDPDSSDRSLSANIERVRLTRNKCYGHSISASMSSTDFNSTWSTIRLVMVDVDAFLNNGNKYQKAVDRLRLESMDPELDEHYENELRKQVEEDRTTRKMVVSLKRKLEEETKTLCGKVGRVEEQMKETDKKVEALDGKVAKLTESPIPPNVREIYNMDIQKWREEDKLYYETHSFPSVMAKVRNQPCVTIVGVPGSGKSATAHHIALKLQEEGYEIVPIKDVRKMEDYGDPRNPQVFVIDDVMGVFGLQKTKLDVMTDYEQKITKPCMDKSKTLMACREAVFNEAQSYKPFLTKEETVISLHSSDHELDDNDKKQILQMYGLNVDLMKSTSRMFPLLCKLFSKETKLQALGYKFFLYPVQCIIDELNNVQKHNKLNYATLVLCMLNENRLSEDILEDENNANFKNMKKKNTLKYCKLESQTDSFKFMDALSAMKGTYTKQSGAKYTFIHDSIFKICAYHYGQQFPDQMLLYMNSSYIANSVKRQTSEPGIAPKVKEKQKDPQCSKGDKSGNDSDRKMESDDDSNDENNESDDENIESNDENIESDDENIESNDENIESDDENIESDDENIESNDENIESDDENIESDDENIEREESFDLCIRLCEDQYSLLAKRLYRDIQNMKLYDVFRNPVLKHPQVCHAFIGVLETKPRTELKSLFLSSHGKVDKIVSKRACVEVERTDEGDRQMVLVDERWKGETSRDGYTCNVRVISWVIYYGHHQIIEYIIQQTEQHNEISELFEITGNSPHQSRSGISTCNVQESENIKLVEQCRLLLLSCYSGDVQTVRVLLPVCKKAINGIGQIRRDLRIDWCFHTPLAAACWRGHVDILKELFEAGADVNIQAIQLDGTLKEKPLRAACIKGHLSVVKELLKLGADVNLEEECGETPLTAACARGYVSVVKELVKARADVNLQGERGNTPLIAATKQGLSTVEFLVQHDWVTQVVNINMSAVYTALILNKPDILKYLIQEQNKINPGTGNVHLFNCLVEIRHAEVKTYSRDDLKDSRDDVVTETSVWCMDRMGDLWKTIRMGDCDVLRHLLCVGLNADQLIQLYDKDTGNSDVRPLLYTLIDEEWFVRERTEKLSILLGADVNVRMNCRECYSVLDIDRVDTDSHSKDSDSELLDREGSGSDSDLLDREGVSVLERTRRRVCVYSERKLWEDELKEYKEVMCELKKHVRRHSV